MKIPVNVDGKIEQRELERVDKTSVLPRFIPKLHPGEEVFQTIAGDVYVIQVNKPWNKLP